MSRGRILLTLFLRMLGISTFVLGGGFAIIAVADEVFSKKLKWTAEGEILEQLPVFQMVPGMICTNTAIYVGNKVAGPIGAAVALAGTVVPSILIFTVVTVGYELIPVDNVYLAAAFAGLRASLAGIILALVVRGWRGSVKGIYGYLAVCTAVFLLAVKGVAAAPIVAASAVLGVCLSLVRRRICEHRAETRIYPSGFWAIPLLFLKYGAVAFGGGYVLVPMYFQDFVGAAAPYLQVEAEEFANVMALTQMTPGSISVNCATFFGYRMSGALGAVVATVAMVLPNYILLLVVLKSLQRFKTSAVVIGLLRGVQPVTTALMLAATWTFAGMSAWMCSKESGIAVSPVCSMIVVLSLVVVLKRLTSVVRLIFCSALLAVSSRLFLGFV